MINVCGLGHVHSGLMMLLSSRSCLCDPYSEKGVRVVTWTDYSENFVMLFKVCGLGQVHSSVTCKVNNVRILGYIHSGLIMPVPL